MHERVATYLKEDYSPEQVAGVLKAQGQPVFLMSEFINTFGMIIEQGEACTRTCAERANVTGNEAA